MLSFFTAAFWGDAAFCAIIVALLVYATADASFARHHRDVLLPWAVVFAAVAVSLAMRMQQTTAFSQ